MTYWQRSLVECSNACLLLAKLQSKIIFKNNISIITVCVRVVSLSASEAGVEGKTWA